MPKLSDLVMKLKKYAINPSVSDEEFLNAFLSPFIEAGRIKNKNGEELHLNKSRTSEIMNQKTDIPASLRKAIPLFEIEDKTEKGMSFFIEENLAADRLDDLLQDLEISFGCENTISKKTDAQTVSTKNNLSEYLTALLLQSIQTNNRCEPEATEIWKNGNNSVKVISGDLFHYGFNNRKKQKNIVVIPVNTAFDTHVTRKIEGNVLPVVSEMTIHGQWLIRLEESGEVLSEIDNRIVSSLNEIGFMPSEHRDIKYGKANCYPIGSVAIIETNNAIYFLLAIAAFDKNNIAKCTPDDIACSVKKLLEVYDRLGQGYDMYMPLMGTGRSRAGLSAKKAYDLLISSLLANNHMISGRITLVIRPEDQKEIL